MPKKTSDIGLPCIDEAVEALLKGDLVVVPTDTVYGLAADPNVPGAEERIYLAKSRDRNKPIPLLAADISDVERYGAMIGPAERKLADAFWPGPLTMVLDVNGKKEGFRVPANDIALAVLRSVGGILRVTSANLSGEPPAMTAGDARQCLGNSITVVIDGGRVSGGVPSSVVELVGDESMVELKILREGAITRDQLSNLFKIADG